MAALFEETLNHFWSSTSTPSAESGGKNGWSVPTIRQQSMLRTNLPRTVAKQGTRRTKHNSIRSTCIYRSFQSNGAIDHSVEIYVLLQHLPNRLSFPILPHLFHFCDVCIMRDA